MNFATPNLMDSSNPTSTSRGYSLFFQDAPEFAQLSSIAFYKLDKELQGDINEPPSPVLEKLTRSHLLVQ